jgi:pimeloyl-ACP methyl ester carboxylesterase
MALPVSYQEIEDTLAWVVPDPRNGIEWDLGAILDVIEAPTAVIGGESMGAALALLFAEAHPSRVDRLLLTAPAFGDEPNPERHRIQTMAEIIEKHGIDAFLKGAAERQRVDRGAPEGVIPELASMQGSHDPKSLVVGCRTVIEWIIAPQLENFASLE